MILARFRGEAIDKRAEMYGLKIAGRIQPIGGDEFLGTSHEMKLVTKEEQL
ncbi:MAG: hypothetical protein ACYTHJ_01880 [Planctomycetota bacterium]